MTSVARELPIRCSLGGRARRARAGGRRRGVLGEVWMSESQTQPARPAWLKVRLRMTPQFEAVARTVHEQNLRTVCLSATCPNLGECWARGTATFMIGGNHCTRRCGFCDVTTARPAPLDPLEPERVAKAVAALGLGFAVITAVARDDLPDGGAAHMAATLRALRRGARGRASRS